MRPYLRTASRTQRQAPPPWQRDVRLLAASRCITMAGAEAGYIALLALAWHITGSATQASLVLLASVFARTLGAPFAGWIGDHLERRRVIVGADIVTGLAFGSLGFAHSMWHVLAAMVIGTFASMTGGAALDASLPSLVPRAELSAANSTMGMARTAGHMLGPVLGGVLVAGFGARGAFLFDGATSFVAAALIIWLRGSVGGGSGARGVGDTGVSHVASPQGDRDPLAGVRVLATDPALRLLMVGCSALCVCFAFVTAAELPLAIEHGLDEVGLSMIVSFWCAGSLVGGWLARKVRVEGRGARVLAINAGVCGVVFAAAGLAPWFSLVLALMAVGGMSMAMADVVESTLLQLRTDDGVRARVLAGYSGLLSAVFGVHLAAGGLIVEATSPGTAYVIGGVWCVLGAVGFAATGRMLAREQLEHALSAVRPRHALEAELAEGA